MSDQFKNSFVAFFPGQGAQHVGMAKDLHDNFKSIRELFEEASDATHLNIAHLSFEGPESELMLTEHTQPCLLTASVAAFRVAQEEFGFSPAAVAGHSLGEYSALVAAEALPFALAVQWVRARGAAMQEAVPAGQGTMAAVMGLTDEKVDELCKQATAAAKERRMAGAHPELTVETLVQPANYNAPGQIVIAGSTDAITEALGLIKSEPGFNGGKAMQLQVSAPFHSRLMQPARDKMVEIFKTAPAARSLTAPYVPNRTARLTQEPGVVLEFLVEQIDHPVLWKQSVTTLVESGYTKGVEFGPGKVLQGLAKRIVQPLGKTFPVLGVNNTETLSAFEKALATQENA